MMPPPSIRRAALRMLLICFLPMALFGRAFAAPTKFDIAAQPAPTALQAFIKQSGCDVFFSYDQMKDVRANTVKGEFEPADAIAQLLAGTGFAAIPQGSRKFLVAAAAETTSAIEGAVRDESGRPVGGAKIAITGTDLSATTDRRGRFTLANVPAGEHQLQVSAEGMQNTRVTDVSVKAGHRLTLSTIVIPTKGSGPVQLEDYVVSAKRNDGVVQLDDYEVAGHRAKPFVDGNLDLPRTIDDVQPYYIFDAKTLETSGAVDVEEFLKQKLTMNTIDRTSSQQLNRSGTSIGVLGAVSMIDLRGVGATLVLVNGKPLASVSSQGLAGGLITEGQPDLNGIPFNAIERIEILPTSASGIYGAKALGGVVNVILKKSFQGGQVSLRFEDSVGGNAPRRNVGFNYGQAIEGGRTRYTVSASWADATPLRNEAVADWHRDYMARAEANLPNHLQAFSLSTNLPAARGSLTNIQPRNSTANNSLTTLTFDDGTPLGSLITFVPAGIGPNATFAELKAALLANAGKWDTELPDTRTENGLRSQLDKATQRHSLNFNLSRQMSPNLEANVSFSYNANDSTEEVPPRSTFTNVPGSSPHNPFQQDVALVIPHDQFSLSQVTSLTKIFSVGVITSLPKDWSATLDYTWSENKSTATYTSVSELGFANAISTGALDLFVDPALLAFDLAAGGPFYYNNGSTRQHGVLVRGQGPLPALPWGQPKLVAGGDYKLNQNPSRQSTIDIPAVANSTATLTGYEYFPRDSTAMSGYAELTMPLVKQNALPLMHALELQAAGRMDRFEVDTGTSSARYNLLTAPPTFVSYSGVTGSGGVPIRRIESYGSNNATYGVKYQPIRDIIFRGSIATAFIPPTPAQLTVSETLSTNPTTVLDPKTGTNASVFTRSGGNANLKPQNSESLNLGFIWAPKMGWFRGLRINVEYYRIQQFDAISTLSAQLIVNNEALWPERVIRDATGRISQVDASSVNVFKRDTDGWDVSADYMRSTSWGRFRTGANHSYISSLQTQYSLTSPAYEAAGFHPGEGGGGPRHKGNLRLEWEHRGWNASWAMRYWGTYKLAYAVGGPTSVQFNGGGPVGAFTTTHVAAQGGDTVEVQSFHDWVVGYTFGTNTTSPAESGRRWGKSLLAGTSLQFGIRNVFDTPPAFDVSYRYFSPYGDLRPRTFWITVKKNF